MKIKMSVPKTEFEIKEIDFVEHVIVPGWISDSSCPVCHWRLHEDKEQQYIIAARSKDGMVRYFHDTCFNRSAK